MGQYCQTSDTTDEPEMQNGLFPQSDAACNWREQASVLSMRDSETVVHFLN